MAAVVLAVVTTLFATTPAVQAAEATRAGILGNNSCPATVMNIKANAP